MHIPLDKTPQPVRIFGCLTGRAIGDFIGQNVIAASVKESFDHATMLAEVNLDSPVHRSVVKLNPAFDHVFKLSPSFRMPLAAFDLESGAFTIGHDKFIGYHGRASDILLAGASLAVQKIGGLPRTARLRVPGAWTGRAEAALGQLGLARDRWFAVVYWREPGYSERTAHSLRDIGDPAPYVEAIGDIVGRQGGQVVKIGHPSNLTLPKDLGVVDLSNIPDSFELQAFALSRARYMLASGSGPHILGSALGTPTAHTNMIDPWGVWNPSDLLVPQRLTLPDGSRLEGRALVESGWMDSEWIKHVQRTHGVEITGERNSARQLIEATRILFDRTEGCAGWREPEPSPPAVRPNAISMPFESRIASELVVDLPR